MKAHKKAEIYPIKWSKIAHYVKFETRYRNITEVLPIHRDCEEAIEDIWIPTAPVISATNRLYNNEALILVWLN